MASFDEKSVPRRHAEATSRNVDGEEVIMLPHAGFVHVLNETGAFLWAHMDGQHTVEEIARAMTDDFELEYATARDDILTILQQLESKQMVVAPGS